MRLARPMIFLTLAIWALAAAGCALPVSKYPLSDKSNSIADERLIGYWLYVPREEEKAPPAPMVIGRQADSEKVLEAVWIELQDKSVDVHRLPLYATMLGERHYISVPVDESTDKGYQILLYQVDENSLRLYFMNKEAIVSAIDSGVLNGVVTRSTRDANSDPNAPFEPTVQSVRITAEPKELAEFLKTQNGACYNLAKPLRFDRVVVE